MLLKAFKYRIYPTEAQKVLIEKHIGASRFLYNLALELRISVYRSAGVSPSKFDLINQISDLRKECVWLKEICAHSLQMPINNLDHAFKSFFNHNSRFPRFKKKTPYGNFTTDADVKVIGDKLYIPKFREGIKIVVHRLVNGKIKRATLNKTASGKYFASVLCETGEKPPLSLPVSLNSTIGIDLGIKSFVITSEGKEYQNPTFLRKQLGRLQYAQSKLSKHKGKKTRRRLAILHEKVASQRKDFLHKVSSDLVKNHDTIAIETLKVANLVKNHKLALSISDAGWSMFADMVEYKAARVGKNVLKIGTFEPSSKTCSECGNINNDLTLNDREWACPGCGVILDRDINAAINIKNFALNNLSVGRRLKNPRKLPTLVGVMTPEA